VAVLVLALLRLRRCVARGAAVRGEHGGHRQHAGHGAYRVLRGLAYGFHGLARVGRHFQGEAHIPLLEDESLDHSAGDDVLAADRVLDRAQGLENGFFGRFGHCLDFSGVWPICPSTAPLPGFTPPGPSCHIERRSITGKVRGPDR